uniref:Major facilitator superfamily (MFS) profile domain-containing protein n=1 Tax=Strigamia maritima TaxID=126957 RepID=T1J905_STRMM
MSVISGVTLHILNGFSSWVFSTYLLSVWFVPILPIYARSLGMSNTEIGALVSIFSALQCISSPFVGRWSDVHGRKSTLVWSLFFSSVSYLILGLSSLKNALPLFIIGRIIAGVVKHSQTLVRAYFADVMNKDDGLVAFSHFLAISNIGYIIGPLIGGRMADTQIGFFSICFIAAFLFLIDTIIIEYQIPNVYSHGHNPNKKQDHVSFFTFITTLEYTKLLDVFLLRFLITFSISLYRENFVLILNEKYSISSKTSGYILSYQAVITVISSFLVAPLMIYTGMYSLLFYCTLILCVTLFSLTASRELWTVIVFLIPLGFCNSTLCNVITELLVARSKTELCGTVVGLGHSIMALSRMLAPVISGFLLDRDVNGPAAVATGFSVITVIVTTWIVYKHHGFRHYQQPHNCE